MSERQKLREVIASDYKIGPLGMIALDDLSGRLDDVIGYLERWRIVDLRTQEVCMEFIKTRFPGTKARTFHD